MWARRRLFFTHDPHGLVAELVGVVNGNDTGLRCIECAGFASGMDRNALAGTRGFIDSGFEFGLGVLVNGGESAVANRIWAGLIDLDEIGALL
jgi:hypothetical protein